MCGKLKLGTVSRKGFSIWSTHYTLPFFASLNVVCIIEEWERSLFTTSLFSSEEAEGRQQHQKLMAVKVVLA